MKFDFHFQPEFHEFESQFIQAGLFWALFIKDDRVMKISVEVSPSDGQGGLKASAAYNKTDADGLPITGVIAVDIADTSRFNHFTETLIHELGHAIGIGTLWRTLGLLDKSHYKCVFKGPKATAAIRAMPEDWNEVLVETEGGPSSAFGHWSEKAYNKELMTPEKDVGEHLAKFTIASLEDVGYKNIDYSLFEDKKLCKDGHTIKVNALITLIKKQMQQ